MLNIDVMYELYTRELVLQKEKYLISLEELKGNHNTLKTLLTSKKDIINLYLNVNLDTILKTTSETFIHNIKFPTIPIYSEGKEVNFESLKLYISKYLPINKKIRKYESYIKDIDSKIISKRLYEKIIINFNDIITDKIVNENYRFEPTSYFGSIYVIRNENCKASVNWGVSNKNKKEILARGGTPFNKKTAPHGEEWLHYHPTLNYFLQWSNSYTVYKHMPILKDYKYKPARGKYGIVAKLSEIKNDREKADKLYTRTLN